MNTNRSWKETHRLYDQLRLKYYMDAEPPLQVPPKASELRWVWLPEGSQDFATTDLDEEQEPHTIGLNVELLRSSKLMTYILLHELSHMRDPNITCEGRGKARRPWLEETVRLAQLGALRL